MYKHHADSINNLIDMYKDNSDVLAITLGGSIAKGRERSDSLKAMYNTLDSITGLGV